MACPHMEKLRHLFMLTRSHEYKYIEYMVLNDNGMCWRILGFTEDWSPI